MNIHQPDKDCNINELYRSLRGIVPLGQAIVALHVGECETTLACGDGGVPSAIVVLAIGTQRTSGDCFRHQPPTPAELENAIMIVEDELVRARAVIGDGARLLTRDVALREIARLAGVAGQTTMSVQIDAVEGVFDRLAALSLGLPASSARLPVGSEFAATLLIVRELMHHLKFATLTVGS